MGKHKQSRCEICYKEMRSDRLKGHMKVHSKTDESMNGTKLKHGEMMLKEGIFNCLKEFVIEKEKEFQKKIVLGKELYKLLGEGLVSTEALPNDMQEAVNLYMKQCNTVDHMDAELKPWQKELLELISSPTDREIIWIVGKSCGEGKTWMQKYIKSMYGIRRVACGISIKATTPNICHALSKHPLSTTDMFLFNVGKSKNKCDAVNYEVLEDLKDGAAFASKYNSQQLKIKTPNVVMVFSNEKPDTSQLAMDRWKLFYIEKDSLVEKQVVKNGDYNNSIIPKRKKQKFEELTDKELEKLEDELCLNLCWRGYHVCNEKDEDNLLLGIDISYLRWCIYNDDVKNKFKCQACPFAREEMEEVNNHFMEHHRNTFRLPCCECNMKFKTINQLKKHYASKHFKSMKNGKRDYFHSEQDDMYANTF